MFRGLLAVAFAWIVPFLSGGCMDGAPKQTVRPDPPPVVFVVETLSIGKGVPAAAREALQKSRNLIEEKKAGGWAVTLSESLFGLEGETRLRVEFADSEAGMEVYEKIRALTENVDLITVKNVSDEVSPKSKKD